MAQRRRERPVTLDGQRVALLSLDEARIFRGGVELGRLAVVELELAVDVAEERLAAMGDALAATPGLTPEPRSKLERALAMLDALPAVPR